MKTPSELQEDRETRHYIIKHNDDIFNVVEDFYFYNKRGTVFPAQFSRCGRQHVTIQTRGGYILREYEAQNIWESSSVRKRHIYNFLRREFSLSNPFRVHDTPQLKNCECLIKDRLKCDGYNNTLEFVEAQFNRAEHVIGHSTAAEDGIYITFKHDIWNDKREQISQALNNDKHVNWHKWINVKVLHVNITPAP